MPSPGMSLRPGTPQSQLWSYMCWLWWSRTLLGVLVPQVCAGGRSLLFWEREISMGQELGADTEIPHRNTDCFLKSCVNLCVYFPQFWPGLGRQWSLKTAHQAT